MFMLGFSTAAAMADKKDRVKADENITVAQLETALVSSLSEFGNHDLQLLLDSGGDQAQWRSKIRADAMKPLARMITFFAECCENGVIPTVKLEHAILNCNSKKRLNWTDKSNDDFANKAGNDHMHMC